MIALLIKYASDPSSISGILFALRNNLAYSVVSYTL